jgi:hypothetical protein
MSLPIKVFSAVLILGCAGLFVLKKPDGNPVLSIDKFIPDIGIIISDAKSFIANAKNEVASIVEKLPGDKEEKIEQNIQAKPDIYRWKDSNGQWQFSDTPPANQTAEAIKVSGNLNKDLVASYEAPQELSIEDDTIDSEATSTDSIIPMTVSPDKVSKLMEDANNIQKLMDDRASQLDKH